ncbi:MAG: NAD-dependent epimerase/dehydratase family protein [Pseudomonadota bacterium]
MTSTALVIGGTGPTGHYIVNGLLKRGYTVTMLHSGKREIDEIPPEVEHVHTDAYDEDCLLEALDSRHFDVCVATYGRLRAVARVMAARCERFLSAGGAPAYRGYMNPDLAGPSGMRIPISEDARLVASPQEDDKGYRIVRTERAVFESIPLATHFRYPFVYGAHQLVPREWLFVRRFRDGRRRIILPDGGLTLLSYGYAGNIADAVLLAVDQPEASQGKIYNVADVSVLTLRQVAETIAEHMGAPLEIINMPWELAVPARPMIMQPQTSHRVQDVHALRRDLGYGDATEPRQAVRNTVDWLLANPPGPGSVEEMVLEDPFDYAAEDRLIDAWQALVAQMPAWDGELEPGLGMAYSGPGGRARSQSDFVE